MAVSIGEIVGYLTLNDQFSSKLDAAGKKMKSLSSSLLPLSAAVGGLGVASLKFATDLNASMANVATLIPGNTERVKELKGNVQELAVATGKASSDIAGGLYQVVSAFGDSAETAKLLEINAKAGAAGLATTLEAINLTSAVTKGYGDTTAEAVQHAADLAFVTVKLGQTTFPELAGAIGTVTPIAAALSVSQEELFAGFATLTGVTGNANEVTTQLKSTLTAFMKPSEDMTAAIKKLGFANAETIIQELGMVGALRAVISTTDGTKESIGELFNNVRSLPAVFALSEGQAATFDTKMQEMTKTTGAMNEAFREQSDGINKAGFEMAQAREELRGLAEKFGDELLPIVTDFARKTLPPLLEGLKGTVEWFGNLPDPVKMFIVGLGALVTAAAPVLYVLGSLTSALGALGPALRLLPLGPVTIAVGGFFASFKLTNLILDAVPGLRKFTDSVVEFGLKLTGVQTALDLWNKHLEKGIDVTSGWTEEQKKSLETFKEQQKIIAETDAAFTAVAESGPKKLAEAVDQLTGSVEKSVSWTQQDITAKLTAVESARKLEEASALVGETIKDLPTAEKILAFAKAHEEAAEKAKTHAKAEADLKEALGLKEFQDYFEQVNALRQIYQQMEPEQTQVFQGAAEGAQKAYEAILRQAEALAKNGVSQEAVRKKLEASSLAAQDVDSIMGILGVTFQQVGEKGKRAIIDWDGALNSLRNAFEVLGADADNFAMKAVVAFQAAGAQAEQMNKVLNDPNATENQKNMAKGIGGVNTAMIAFKSGALGGAAAGAKFGSSFGPWGTAIGAAGGALLGFIGGLNKEEKQVNDMRDAFFEAQGGFEEFSKKMAAVSDQDWAKKIFDVKTVDQFNKLVSEAQGLLDQQSQAQQALQEATERYGFTIEELGPAMQRQQLDKMAAQLYQDFQLLTASGIDVNTVIERMGPSLLDFVNTSKAAGQAIPEAMRPVIEQLIASGQLLDENGEAYGSVEEAGISFAKTQSEMFDELIDKIDKMVNALLGIGDVNVSPRINFPEPPNYPGANYSKPGYEGFAEGGVVTSPAFAMVGEAGPEAIVPLSQLSGMGSGKTEASFSPGQLAALSRAVSLSVRDALQQAQ